MTANASFSTNLLLAYAAYFVGTASPGPSNLAIISIAASHGRKAALTFALGVISGSMFWATVATLGVSAALIAYSQFIIAVKIFGGLYLLWLAFKSGRNALATAAASVVAVERTPTLTSVYSRGVMLHLTNPKAILVWVSIVALSSNGTGPTQPTHSALVMGCAAIGCLVFGSYAVLFSTDSARRMYVRTRRALEGCLAVVFGIAGIRLLASRL
ncbi:Lysine exporter protein (LYSE/YGGA) [Paraburkholderia piptadeniae]|uniref:Lysine exporter protein (LYSE/YGGA) n=1 Tax=Paraburkholderia piptadeniae TaxID=1701573 RepID=A0A1N7SJU5_9BURK|nr:LysE family translocator [Paraburkholderia piptadeniae]SIT47638.1 Lysine exporter protein (LYSE/YGGA) [Paraburkholderia piptadeniae]